MENITYRVGSGEKVLFWRERLLGEWPLARQFPNICNCALNKDARVHCYLSSSGEHKVWFPILRRNLKEHEEDEFISLINLLSGAYIAKGGEDVRVWKASKDAIFSISSFSLDLARRVVSKCSIGRTWKIKAQPRVVVFGWITPGKKDPYYG